ncbi:hypothetical protein [Clostridium scatologenes]|uniref:Cell division protein FtsL n=1 Tax=Clostridium scatologenes TaxID=1548 RepID=A0A0E3K1T0_CLOSL|nr:hypothetical protein [Clostridium scatologenes]AKA70245.1 hypothetical protein CSCA_3120 [Clostridium scatologenes]
MIVVNKENVISGNTVLQPEYVPYVEDEQEKLRRRAKEKKLRQKRLKGKVKIIRNITLAFTVGIILIGRYCVIYNMQQKLNSISNNINEINRDNENLKVDLVKYNNIQYIEDAAVSKLHMILPDKGIAVQADLDKEVIKTSDKKSDTQTYKSIWSKLNKMLFN